MADGECYDVYYLFYFFDRLLGVKILLHTIVATVDRSQDPVPQTGGFDSISRSESNLTPKLRSLCRNFGRSSRLQVATVNSENLTVFMVYEYNDLIYSYHKFIYFNSLSELCKRGWK